MNLGKVACSVGAVLLAAVAAIRAEDVPAPEKPVVLLPGLGSLHHTIKTRSPEAQQLFDQGLTLVYGFNHDEAIRSFRRAAELDPDAVMPLWGIGYALGPNINMDVDPEREKAAFEAAQKALKAAKDAPDDERAYVKALAKRYSADPKADLKRLAAEFADAMRDVSEAFPDDLDAATLYAESLMNLNPWKLWDNDGKPAEETEEIVGVLERVLSRDPSHVGANHYYIHAVEASPWPERALPSAARLEKLVPGAGHLVHMPAHIYMRTGFYDAAAKSNAQAVRADEAYIKAYGVQGVYPLMYYNHNLDFLAAAASMEGRYGEAKKAADRSAANVAPAVKDMPMAEYLLSRPLEMDLRFAQWSSVLKAPEPAETLSTSRALWHFARGVALAAKRDASGAEKERQGFAEQSAKVPEDAVWGLNASRGVLEVAKWSLDARIAAAQKDDQGAITAWTQAVDAQDRLRYDEPPPWYYPVRESLGAALFRAGRKDEAEKVFREDLARNPRNPRSLYGLWESLKAQKKTADAVWVRRAFQEAWKNSEIEVRMEDL